MVVCISVMARMDLPEAFRLIPFISNKSIAQHSSCYHPHLTLRLN